MEFLLDSVDRFPLLEEFADSHEQPDPVPLALLANGVERAAVQADSNAGSDCGQQIGGDRNDEARSGVRRRQEMSPLRSAQSTNRVNP